MEQLRYALGIATLAVVVIAGWFLFDLLSEDEFAGRFQLDVVFEDARGLRSGADVRYRGVRVGQVYEVGITADANEKAVVRLVLFDGFERLACTNSRFWIVAPRFNGLTNGATGLDTLVRDSYVTFLTPSPLGPRLATGRISGLERPYLDPGAGVLDALRHGDLTMYLHAPEKHGLRIGSAVRFRGIDTGDVRGIAMAPDGGHVVITLRIAQGYRNTVTDRSAFWVARPRLSGALVSGIAIEDLNALLTPFVGYQTEMDVGSPALDGFHAVATSDRPDLPNPAITLPEQPRPDPTSVDVDGAIRLVSVTYEAVEKDWFSPDDTIKRESSGVLFIDSAGRTVVLTPRSSCDAAFFVRDAFGADPEIDDEKLRVSIPNGGVFSAGRTWVDPDGLDLALLVVQDAPTDLTTTEFTDCDFTVENIENGSFRLASPDGAVQDGDVALTSGEETRGRAALRNGKLVGIVGQEGAGEPATRQVIPIRFLPVELRPDR